MDEEKRYGISGAVTIESWRKGMGRVSDALRKSDLNKADLECVLGEAKNIAAKYQRYERTTDLWKRTALILLLLFSAVGVVSAIIQTSVGNLIFFALIGLALSSVLYFFVIKKDWQ